MTCPACGWSGFSTGNGCNNCGYWPTAKDRERANAALQTRADEARNRSKNGREWAGIEMMER